VALQRNSLGVFQALPAAECGPGGVRGQSEQCHVRVHRQENCGEGCEHFAKGGRRAALWPATDAPHVARLTTAAVQVVKHDAEMAEKGNIQFRVSYVLEHDRWPHL